LKGGNEGGGFKNKAKPLLYKKRIVGQPFTFKVALTCMIEFLPYKKQVGQPFRVA